MSKNYKQRECFRCGKLKIIMGRDKCIACYYQYLWSVNSKRRKAAAKRRKSEKYQAWLKAYRKSDKYKAWLQAYQIKTGRKKYIPIW
jgi:hypothetical protein